MLDEETTAELMKLRQLKCPKEQQLWLMSQRISVLEDALHLSSEDGETHPLLSSELLRIKQDNNLGIESEVQEVQGSDGAEGGTLLRSGKNQTRYFGASATEVRLLFCACEKANDIPTPACSSYRAYCLYPPSLDAEVSQKLLQTQQIQRPLTILNTALPSEVVQASAMFPFVPDYLRQPSIYEQLISRLPDYPRVTALIEAYFANLVWFVAPIDRPQMTEEVIPLFYPNRRPIAFSAFREENLHDLALLFSLLASGSVADLTQEAINFEAEELDKLSRAALGLRDMFKYGSVAACQTLLLLGSYETATRRKTSSEGAGKLMTFGVCVALSVSRRRRFNRLPSVMIDSITS